MSDDATLPDPTPDQEDDPLARTAKEAVEGDPVAGAVGSMGRDRDTDRDTGRAAHSTSARGEAAKGADEDSGEPGDDAERGTDTSTGSE